MPSATIVKSNFAANLELADLPHTLTDEHKSYWNHFVGEPFKDHIGPRGKKSSNARSWTREVFITEFCDKFFDTLSPEVRSDYETILGPVGIPFVCLFNLNLAHLFLKEGLLLPHEPLVARNSWSQAQVPGCEAAGLRA